MYAEALRLATGAAGQGRSGPGAGAGAGAGGAVGGDIDPAAIEAQLADLARKEVATRERGHWFRCPNGHLYLVGECGEAMERSLCPDCKEAVGDADVLEASNRRDERSARGWARLFHVIHGTPFP